MEINNIIESQQQYFKTNCTYEVSFRIDALKKLKANTRL